MMGCKAIEEEAPRPGSRQERAFRVTADRVSSRKSSRSGHRRTKPYDPERDKPAFEGEGTVNASNPYGLPLQGETLEGVDLRKELQAHHPSAKGGIIASSQGSAEYGKITGAAVGGYPASKGSTVSNERDDRTIFDSDAQKNNRGRAQSREAYGSQKGRSKQADLKHPQET